MNTAFTPHHLHASAQDLAGNNGIGRYILLPGSDGRAKEIAEHFDNMVVKTHTRGHHLYLGNLEHEGLKIEVAAISSGMGCPSMEIILHELFHLGAKRFLRVGTAGSLQPEQIPVGHIVNAQASVRDEGTTINYMPLEIPAMASLEFTSAILFAAEKMQLGERLHTGIVHCKSALYAREFGSGPLGEKNKDYIKLLSECGIMASEMETAALFVQAYLYDLALKKQGKGPSFSVLAGAILGTVSDSPFDFQNKTNPRLTDDCIALALETIKTLAVNEQACL